MRKLHSTNSLPYPRKPVPLPAKTLDGQAAADQEDPSLAFVLVVLGLHFGLALLLRQFGLLATVHAYLTLALGLLFLTQANRQPERLLYILAYIAGVDLIWRGSNASIFYETGKYALLGFSFMGLLLQRKQPITWRWPLALIVLLVPSIFILPYFDRQAIAFNLAGPVALAVASVYMSTLQLSLPQFKRMLLALLVPSASLGFLALFFTLEAEELTFTGVSLYITSANIGPNQASSIIGLAMVAAFCYAMLEKKNPMLRNLMILIMLWMLGQAMLTFSRGGLWTALGAIVIGALFLARDGRMRAQIVGLALVLVPLFTFVIFPAIDDFTGNTLSARLQDPSATRREDLLVAEWEMFTSNPVFGIGPGQSAMQHALYIRWAHSHTEYSRLLAEHGLFGLAVLLIISYVTLKRMFANGSPEIKAFALMATFWALLFMGHSATRLMVVAFMFALPELSLKFGEQQESPSTQPEPASQLLRPGLRRVLRK